MEATVGAGLLVFYVATMLPLYRLARSRPAWMRRGIRLEYLMLSHLAVLVAGCAMIAHYIRAEVTGGAG